MLCLLCPLCDAAAQNVLIRGIVRDSVTDQPLAHASVSLGADSRGALTDDSGIFQLSIPRTARTITVSCMGYHRSTVPVNNTSLNLYAIYLQPEVRQLDEVVVTRRKYSKRNNPAVDFVRSIKERAQLSDPRRNPNYNYRKYERITMALNDVSPDPGQSAMLRRHPFLAQHIDTSEVTGKPILNISIKETVTDVHYRREPRAERQIVEAVRSEGIDEIADQQSMQTFMTDVLREIDLYDNDVNILQNRFVSPLSPIGADFYRYYLTDTLDINGRQCIELAFYPRNKSMFGFNGHIYVEAADTTMAIYKVDMTVPADINLNFVDQLYISQTYKRAPDGSRLKTSDDMTLELSLLPGAQGVYIRRSVVYDRHDFDSRPDSLFAGLGDTRTAEGADMRDSTYWENARLLSVSRSEREVDNLMERLRKVPLFYWGEHVVRLFFTGWVPTAKESKFDFGPLNTTLSYNTAEGVRLRGGGMTTANLSSCWFGRGYLAYGFRDHRWKYMAELEYSFIDKKYHAREFPVQSLRLSHQYDLDQIGQHYLYTNPDNMFLSWKRMSDTRVTYRRLTSLQWTCELRNNLSFNIRLSHEQQQATRWLPFVDGYGQQFGHYDESTATFVIRYAPGEKFYQTKSMRIPINLDAPVVQLSHTMALKGFAGSRFGINKTELTMGKRFWLSAFGYIDGIVSGGHVWSRSPYINLLIPNVNLSYTIQPESFALMNPMEFINDSYAQWDLTYWANGLLLNQIPLVKKLKLREVVGFKGLYGHLSRRNDPQHNPELYTFPADANTRPMNHGPYMELSAGVDNIFRCLRVDYVWRLNYRTVPYPIDRSGLRIALHVTF